MSITHSPYVRCFWTGSLHLTNGLIIPVHCTHISTKSVTVDAPEGVYGSKLVKLELNAMHEGKVSYIKALCNPKVDILNEKSGHSIRLSFHSIAKKDVSFIKEFADAHT